MAESNSVETDPIPYALPANFRSVLVIGKTGAGKSTLANVFLNLQSDVSKEKQFKVERSHRSVTTECDHKDSCFSKVREAYEVRVIDTVGLFDTSNRTNKAALQDMRTHLKKFGREGLSLIVFVWREGRFTHEEKRAFDFIRGNLRNDISIISAFVITNCETMNATTRGEIVKEFKENDVTKEIASFMKKGIYTVGFPDILKNPEVREFFQESMKEDRDTLLKLLIRCDCLHHPEQIFRPRCTLL